MANKCGDWKADGYCKYECNAVHGRSILNDETCCTACSEETTPAPARTEVIASSLTFGGLTEADARSMESDLAQGIADSLAGVSAEDVSITGYTVSSGRRLTSSLVVHFEVTIAAEAVDAVQSAVPEECM